MTSLVLLDVITMVINWLGDDRHWTSIFRLASAYWTGLPGASLLYTNVLDLVHAVAEHEQELATDTMEEQEALEQAEEGRGNFWMIAANHDRHTGMWTPDPSPPSYPDTWGWLSD